MKNAKLFHGTGCSPNSYWFPYLKRELEKRRYTVYVPQFPNPDKPLVKTWLPVALKQGAYDADTVIVGHSAGTGLALSLLERINTQVRLVILVAGFARANGRVEPILQKSYDWKKIKKHAKKFIFINSDNDPWGADDNEGRYLFDHLGGTQIIKHGEGHMGSDTFRQPYKEFPLLVKLIE